MTETESCDASLAEATRAMASWQTDARVVDTRSALVVIGTSRFPTPYSNAVLPRRPGLPPEELLDESAALLSDRHHIVWAQGRGGGGLGDAARARGFAALDELPAMVTTAAPSPREAPGVVVDDVKDESAFDDFVRVSLLAYAEAGLPAAVGRSLLARPEPALARASIAVARIDREPVAAALSITDEASGVGGVSWVGPVPAARKRGAADAVTRHVTRAAFDRGARIVSLQASAAGAPVYLRMGYREVGRYARYLSPRPARG